MCFAAGTLVETGDGLRPIEEVEVGDLVWARDDETGEEGWKPITEVFITPDRELLELTFEAAGGTTQVLRVTPEHLLWSLDDGEWDESGHLNLGEQVDALHGPMWLVAAVASLTTEPVYNLEVGDSHTYFVGEAGVWAHNKCRGLWQATKEGTDRAVQWGGRTISRHKSTGLWWSKDTARHGGSGWKVFKEEAGGLRHFRDADQYGDFIVGKHKGPVGEFIPWSQLAGK